MRVASTKTAAALWWFAAGHECSGQCRSRRQTARHAQGQRFDYQHAVQRTASRVGQGSEGKQIARQAQQETNEQIAATAKKTNELSTFDQKLAWAAKTQFKGDVRFRQETVQNDGVSNNKDQNRQRIRARLVPTAKSTRKLTPVFALPPAATMTRVPPTRT
jgi:hypothetical protein